MAHSSVAWMASLMVDSRVDVSAMSLVGLSVGGLVALMAGKMAASRVCSLVDGWVSSWAVLMAASMVE